MRIDLIKNVFMRALSFFLVLVAFTFIKPEFSNANLATEFNMQKDATPIVEVIRLSVPSELRSIWLNVEESSWQPWLLSKKGFIDRKLYWDKSKEEGLLLISWSSKKAWKSIPISEIDEVQSKFEKLAREKTGQLDGNPFPLKYEGELYPQ